MPDSYRLGRCPPDLARRVRARCGGALPELRPALGAAAGVGPGRPAGQRTGLQPLRRRRVQRRARPALRGGPRASARSGLGRGGDSLGCARRACGWPWSPRHRWTASRCRIADFDPVWAAFSDEGVAPVFHVSEFESPLHPAWRDRRARRRRAALRLHLLVPGAGRRPGQSDPHRRRSSGSRSLRIGVVELTAGWVPQLPPAHRRGFGLLRPAPRRALSQAVRPPVRVLPAPGPGGCAALRDAEPSCPQGRGGHLHAREATGPMPRGWPTRWRRPSAPWPV